MQERQTVLEYLENVGADDLDEAVESFRSAYLPMHCKPMGVKLYRKGCFVAAVQGGAEIFLQKINNAYQSLLITTLKLIVNPGGSVARHPVSNTVYVQHAHSCICISLNDIRGEIMLFPETGNNYAVVDPFRQKF